LATLMLVTKKPLYVLYVFKTVLLALLQWIKQSVHVLPYTHVQRILRSNTFHDLNPSLCRFVLVALTRHEGSRSQLARARSFLMQILTSSLHWIHWLCCSVCPSLILCRLAGRDSMQIVAAILHADWLDGRTLEDWHLA
jgi:hypothetical protein